MPTPASNTNPSSPRSYSFSTCPDDIQQSSHSNRHSRDVLHDQSNMHIQHAHSTNAVSPLVIGEPSPPEGLVSDDAIMDDTQGSDAPSSRSATLSPPPQSNTTAITSPIPSAPDVEPSKIQDESEIGNQLSRESSGCVRHATEPRLSAQEHTRNTPFLDQDQNGVDAETQEDDFWSPSMGADYSCVRNIPSLSSSYLRSGSKFHGTQQSERQVYDVQVEIKRVDLRESFLCGYLRIQGLTEDHPTLTTYFEGEIIGTKYSFFTQNESWGANSKVDMSHWAKFNAFRPIQKQARNGHYPIRDVAQRENIFMRWKEHFLVPDHRVRTITGASFEGFYYICFNQVKGEVSGIYFHSKSEKFQQLELKHVPDRGCFSGVEFR